ncbi:MAG: YdhR family protein [Chloroflexota bacterium]
MHVQIVSFRLKDLTEAEFRTLCDQLAPTWAAVPGLISKVWLANPATNTYGGVYTWRDRQAMEQYTRSELFAGLAVHPNLADLASTDFGVLEGPTRVTHGLAGLTEVAGAAA